MVLCNSVKCSVVDARGANGCSKNAFMAEIILSIPDQVRTCEREAVDHCSVSTPIV